MPTADRVVPIGGAPPAPRSSGVAGGGVARRRSARAVGLVALAGVLLVVVGASLALGTRRIALHDVAAAFTAYDGSDDHLVVRELRLPRTLLGVLVGAALGAAGALMQAITRNPLADPGLLGVNAGASLAVVLGIAAFGLGSVSSYVWLALAGALVASVAVYALGSMGRGGATPVRLALAGATLSALLAACISAIALVDQQTLDQYRFWVVGSLAGRDRAVLGQVAPFVAVGLLLAFACARPLNALGLGEDVARSLGARVGRTRAATGLAVTLLCGAATAACGPVGFIGLVVPLAARSFVGPDQRWLVPCSALLGPIVLLTCDVAGRLVARPSEVQVGIMTAALGGPAFVALVRRVRMAPT